MEIFNGNSNASKVSAPVKPREQKKLEPITHGAAKPRGLKRFFSNFFVQDIKTVKDNVIDDVIIPSSKKLVGDTAVSFINHLLWGKNVSPLIKGGQTGLMSTAAQYIQASANLNKKQQDIISNGKRSSSVFRVNDIGMATPVIAESALEQLRQTIATTELHEATIANFCQLIDVNYDWIDNDWGWRNLDEAFVYAGSDGNYYIKFPAPIKLV